MKSGYIAVKARKKPPDNERLFNVLHQIAPIVTKRLLADAEILKYVLEELRSGDFAGDGSEMADCFAQVLGNKVRGQ